MRCFLFLAAVGGNGLRDETYASGVPDGGVVGYGRRLCRFGMVKATPMGGIDTLVLSVSTEAVRSWNRDLSEMGVSFPKGNGRWWREIEGVTKK